MSVVRLIITLMMAIVLPTGSVVAQAHRHTVALSIDSGTNCASIGAKETSGSTDLAANCPICHQAHRAGPLIVPGDVTLGTPGTAGSLSAASILRQIDFARHLTSCRSRAPPTHLRA